MKKLILGGFILLFGLTALTASASYWSVAGDWVLTFVYGGNYNHDISVTQDEEGNLEGTGGYPAGGPYSITETIEGFVDGNNVTIESSYDGISYSYAATGTINSDGSMQGTLTTSAGQVGPWSAPAGSAYLVNGSVSGGGQIIEEVEEEEYKISFGGQVLALDSGEYTGEWQINFHNVSNDDFDKARFHATEVVNINFYGGNSGTCDDAMNMTLRGTLNGEEGYKVIFRAGDYMDGRMAGEYDYADTVRIELYNGEGKIYDTHSGDFEDESSCVGTARTGLDRGNIEIYQ